MSGAPWALAAAGLLALAGGARRGARQVVPSQVIQEAKDLSRKFRQDFPSWRKDFEEEPVFNLFWGRLKEISKGHEVLGGGTQRVVLASRDRRYVIKLTHEPEGNLWEAAAWRDAGPKTRKLLVPVVAADPKGHWLIMKRVTPTSWCEFEDPYPPGMLDLKRRFKALGFLDWQDHNVSEDMRVYDYAEDVSLKGSPARRPPPPSPPVEIPSRKALRRYVDDCECYEYAQSMADDFGFRRATGGYFFDGKLRDHAWVVMPDGTILDSTHGQFVAREKIRIAKPGTAKHRVYVEDVHMTEAQLLETFGPP